jgi:hypothetical protein
MSIDRKLLPAALAELTQLLHEFFYRLDEFQYEELVALMEPDALWHRQGKVQRGAKESLAALAQRSRTQRIRHVITNVQLTELDASQARCVAYMTVYKHDDGVDAPAPRTIRGPSGFLLVSTHFRRHDDRWLVAEMQAAPEFQINPS